MLQLADTAPARSHLVAPQPAPRVVQLDLQALQAQVEALEGRVRVLEAPRGMQRLWQAIQAWWRRTTT